MLRNIFTGLFTSLAFTAGAQAATISSGEYIALSSTIDRSVTGDGWTPTNGATPSVTKAIYLSTFPNGDNNKDPLKLAFGPDNGKFTLNDDGSAFLTGTVQSVFDPAHAFELQLEFAANTGPEAPTKGLFQSAYVENGGPIDSSTWQYFDFISGTLTGIDFYDGVVMDFLEKPIDGSKPPQLGYGANNKNTNLGLSFWFFLTTSECDTIKFAFCDAIDDLERHNDLFGDVNIDLLETPLPAGILLFGTGLAGLAAARRRRKTA